ncbi:hypothetical protein BX600DRAFT_459288 [Xylariales sp. PMI_506]|nr:hypothetical protein BX600DRAFT_459288 [Xylariales sp. PMI_506]
MVRSPGSWCIQSARFVLLLATVPTIVAALSLNASEADLIFPRAGERFTLNNDTGLPVIVALQNPETAWSHGWVVSWSLQSGTEPTGGVPLMFGDNTGSIGNYSNGYTPVTLQQTGPYIGLSHSYWYASANPIAPGEYTFSWSFTIGPWCNISDDNPSQQEWAISHEVSEGSFVVTVAAATDDAPYPTLTGTCASSIGAVSFAKTTTWNGDWQGDNSPSCVETAAAVTDAPAPCSATLDAAVASQVSQLMKWTTSQGGATAGGASATAAATATGTTAATATAGVSASGTDSSGASTTAKSAACSVETGRIWWVVGLVAACVYSA